MSRYPAAEIEARWQKYWQEKTLFKTKSHPKKKFYNLVMFAYPSGDLHMGHCKNYVIGDTITRHKRRVGYDVLHPFGWDAFGLPAENAAILRNIQPHHWTLNNIDISRNGLKKLGVSFDWEREVITCIPEYYKWTQWIFLLLYHKNLAYRKEAYVYFCPGCQTVLANEQIVDGKCYRCDSIVTKKRLAQWFFKITAYTERLLNDLDRLQEWPENVKTMQKNWIGKSTGCVIDFPVDNSDQPLSVFTTRADTIYGVTFMAVAPEHPLIDFFIKESPHRKKIESFVEKVLAIPDQVRSTGKQGINTSLSAISPLSGEKIPIFITDYILASYGTGAVMGVPAHDQRDYEFAKEKGLPIKQVIHGGDITEEAYIGEGKMINSGDFTGLDSETGRERIAEKLDELSSGGFKVEYRLRDWLISRQRYWGAPIPIIYCSSCGIVPVPEEDLPVLLPEGEIDFMPKGKSPLAARLDFINTPCPKCGGEAKRDADTMDTFVCSSWYYLRYLDPKNDMKFCSYENAERWLPIDQYIGGIEHATGHLIYFRFLAKVLYDQGLIPVEEPAKSLFTQGMILKDGEKMSASRGNAVPLNDFLDKYGADVARINILFTAPPENDSEWTDEGVVGSERFLSRVYRLVNENKKNIPLEIGDFQPETKISRALFVTMNKTIKKVTEDLDRFKFNTAVAALMEYVNYIYTFSDKKDPVFGRAINALIQLLSPFAPHLADELWMMIGGKGSLLERSWITPNREFLEDEKRTIVIQVDGRLRGKIEVDTSLPDKEIKELALTDSRINKFLSGKEIKRVISVPQKLINIVTK